MTRGLFGTLLTIVIASLVVLTWGWSYEEWGYFRGKLHARDFKARRDFRIEAYRGLVVLAVRRADIKTPDDIADARALGRLWLRHQNPWRPTRERQDWMPSHTLYDVKSIPGFRDGRDPDFHLFSLPFWFILVLCLTPATWMSIRSSLRRIEQRKHARAGTCVQCAYDLRASADRCPECGTAFTPSSPYSGERVGERGERRSTSTTV